MMVDKTAIGEFAVDGFNLAAVIRKTGDKCPAGEWETICVVQSADWKELAALYAAAPDLYEALKPFADMDFLIVGGGSEAVIAMCDRARAALNKAEGK